MNEVLLELFEMYWIDNDFLWMRSLDSVVIGRINPFCDFEADWDNLSSIVVSFPTRME